MASRGEVLAFRRRIGFASSGRLEQFVVLQSNEFRSVVPTVLVAPVDDVLPLYENNPTAVRVTVQEGGTPKAKIVLPSNLMSMYLDRFEPNIFGRLTIESMVSVEKALLALLNLD